MKHQLWAQGRVERDDVTPHADALYATHTEVRRVEMLEQPVGWVSYTTFKGDRVENALLLRHWVGGSLTIMNADGSGKSLGNSLCTEVEILYWKRAP